MKQGKIVDIAKEASKSARHGSGGNQRARPVVHQESLQYEDQSSGEKTKEENLTPGPAFTAHVHSGSQALKPNGRQLIRKGAATITSISTDVLRRSVPLKLQGQAAERKIPW